jgi:hypothetical protein
LPYGTPRCSATVNKRFSDSRKFSPVGTVDRPAEIRARRYL